MAAISSTNSLSAPWVNLNPGKYTILERHKPEYKQLIMKAGTSLVADVAAIVADYVADGKVMDRQGWLEYFGVDIGEETANVKEALKFENFYEIYHGPNPVDDLMDKVPADKSRQVCESSLIPIIRPETVKKNGLTEAFSLNKIQEISKNPIKGYPAKYPIQDYAPSLDVIRMRTATKGPSGNRITYTNLNCAQFLDNERTKTAEPSALVIMLKQLSDRDKLYTDGYYNNYIKHGIGIDSEIDGLKEFMNVKTKFKCRPLPNALSQITTLMVHYVVTGEPPKQPSLFWADI